MGVYCPLHTQKKPFIHKKMSFLHQNIHSDATSHLFQSQQNIQSKGNKNSAKFHLMPKKFCGFCKVFCSKKIAEIRKNFQKNIFSSKNLSKNFGFFIDFSLFHLSKSADFCHLYQFFTATFPLSNPNTTPPLFTNLPPKYHNFSLKHQSTTHHLFTKMPHSPHIPVLILFPPCLLFHLCFHPPQSILFSYSLKTIPFPICFNSTCFNK